MIIMAALLMARGDKRDELVQILKALLEEARNRTGCRGGMAAQDLDGSPGFLVYLSWDDHAALNHYTSSEAFKVLMGASTILLAEPARFRFFRFDAPDDIPSGFRSLLERPPALPQAMHPDFGTGAEADGCSPIG